MNVNIKLGRAQARTRRSEMSVRRARRSPLNIKWVSALLFFGIVALAGGGVFAATRPTWHPSAAEVAGAARPVAPTHGAFTAADEATKAASATHSRATLLGTGRAFATMPMRTHPSSSITYTVKPEDTLSGIAEWFKLHGYGRLYEANMSVIGSNPNLIIPGERITISHGAMSLHSSTGA